MSWPARFESASRILGLTVAASSLVFLWGGWVLGVESLKTALPGFAGMKGNTALALSLLGFALWLSRTGSPPARRRFGRACAVLTAAIGTATLVEHFFGLNLGIDEMLFIDAGIRPLEHPGRPSCGSAAGIVFLGAATGMLDWRGKRHPAQWLAALALFVASLSLAAYLYDAAAPSAARPYGILPVHGALPFIVMALAVLCARPERGFMRVVTGEGPGGMLARQMLPAVLLFPFVFVSLMHQVAGFGGVPQAYGVALLAALTAILLACLTAFSAHVLEREDVQRRQAEERFRLAVEGSPYAILSVNQGGLITLVNAQAETLFGYRRAELIGQPLEILVPAAEREKHVAFRTDYFRTLAVRGMGKGRNLKVVRKDGGSLPVEISLAPITSPGVAEVLAVVIDISKRLQAEAALRESETQFRLMVTSIRDYAIILLDPEGHVAAWNPGAEKLKGYRAEEIMGQSFARFYEAEDLAAGRPQWQLRIAREQGHCEDEGWRVRKDGRRFWANVVIAAVRDDGRLRGFVKVTRDLTERKRMEEQLRSANQELDRRVVERTRQLEETNRKLVREIAEREQAETAVRAQLAENEVLLKEIHHRVKNNLQIVWSLLDLQTASVSDAVALGALRDSQERVKSMALVHQVLYQSGCFERIEFRRYLATLTEGLWAAYQAREVGLELAGEPLTVDLNTAIPLGLIVNELVSNSLKHGFPGARRGRIRIELSSEAGLGMLSVEDDGVGLPAGFSLETSKTLGLQLVHLLSRQIDAEITLLPGPGTGFRLRFPIKESLI